MLYKSFQLFYNNLIESCIYMVYNMIKDWRHKGLRNFYETGSKAGIQPKLTEILKYLLFQLANAVKSEDMNTPGNNFHPLQGNLKGYHSVSVSGNWRLIFKFKGNDAILVDYIDYH